MVNGNACWSQGVWLKWHSSSKSGGRRNQTGARGDPNILRTAATTPLCKEMFFLIWRPPNSLWGNSCLPYFVKLSISVKSPSCSQGKIRVCLEVQGVLEYYTNQHRHTHTSTHTNTHAHKYRHTYTQIHSMNFACMLCNSAPPRCSPKQVRKGVYEALHCEGSHRYHECGIVCSIYCLGW